METIITLVTIVVTFLLGLLSKKLKLVDSKLIPMQNLAIGTISMGVYFLISKDISVAITLAGVGTGGAYDLLKALKQLLLEEEE